MRFWDGSAVLPLLVDEPPSAGLLGLLEADPSMVVWWATPTECVSALARREREGSLSGDRMEGALERLDTLAAAWREVNPTSAVRASARRMLRVHPLRTPDALQLAAAAAVAEGAPATLEVVTLDKRLAGAARREGFRIVP